MQAIDVLDSPLRWETERQNRIHQEALEQRKKAARGDVFNHSADASASRDTVPISAASRVPHGREDELVLSGNAWSDYLFRVPAMRSALIPLDEANEGAEWSKPFSLQKADMEPWLSFFKGYKQSRLFLEARGEDLQLDFPVRALLGLKRAPHSIILEPPVQIDAQVEYQDFEDELRTTRDSARLAAMRKVAHTIHEKQLEQAILRGREMGDRLYDELMGKGYANLLSAWMRQHKRKPTVQELHQMLTTGRTMPERQQVRADAREPQTTQAMPVQEPISAKVPNMPSPREFVSQSIPKHVAAPEKVMPPASTPEVEQSRSKPDRRRQMFLYFVHAAVSCAAIAAYVWVF